MSRASVQLVVAWALIAANAVVIILVCLSARKLGVFADAALLATLCVVGGVLVIKLPHNLEAWLLLIVASFGSLAAFARFEGGWVPPLGLISTQLLLRFPNGELPSPRWRWFSWATVCYVTALTVILSAANPATEEGDPNSLYVSWLHGFDAVVVLFPVFSIASVASLVIRFRQAGAVEREQIRWIAWAAATVAVIYTATLAASFDSPWGEGAGPVLYAMQAVALLSFALVPLAIGVAVLKYRLYDIDRIISRTTSYAVVTGLVLATYVLIVALGSRLLPDSSSLAVAAATLAAAGLFRPLLKRVQASVDKRFNRERYNATRAVDAFGKQLREVVDADAVAGSLSLAVHQTLEPGHVRLWLRDSGSR